MKKKLSINKIFIPPIWSGMKINESAGMIPLYNFEPSNSFHYHSYSLPLNTPNQAPPKYSQPLP